MLMPNGTDPVSGALVFAVDKSATNHDGEAPDEPYLAYTYSEADGTFELTGVPTGSQTFKIQKGAFEKTFDFDVVEGSNTLDDDTTTLPSETGSGGSVGSMAVVTGSFDAIQNVLARLGLGDHDASGALTLGTETFTLIDGNNSLSDAEYQNFDEFFADPANFDDFRTIFLNCGNDYELDFFDDADAVNGLTAWVENGGRLYCTDWSYDFCEQLFPEYIDFAGDAVTDGLSATAETPDVAQNGGGETSLDATIEDAALLAWLDGLGATNPDDTVNIVDWLIAWAAIDDVSTDVKVWARADVTYGFPEVSGNRPVTVTFDVGDGVVLFSSYHTEEEPQAELTPQDRILQYLVFEVL
ncbi:MAG TPA: hypothetical protein ENO21_03520 [Firmicutes bacterium]|nr:hypothetical protein [Bacillota bacterium]